jgi:hypothetical protein
MKIYLIQFLALLGVGILFPACETVVDEKTRPTNTQLQPFTSNSGRAYRLLIENKGDEPIFARVPGALPVIVNPGFREVMLPSGSTGPITIIVQVAHQENIVHRLIKALLDGDNNYSVVIVPKI